MAGRDSTINPVAKDDNTAKVSMMDLWKQSIERAKKDITSAVQVEKSEEEKRAELEQKIRNGQIECPTCVNRTYKDDSDDGGVSFQAARHIASPTAAVSVMSHEHEHVSKGKADERESGGEQVSRSTVTLTYSTCPQCGRRYVSGGLTKTAVSPSSYGDPNRLGVLDSKA